MSYYLEEHLSSKASLPLQLMQLIKPQHTLLDVGCGNGSLKQLFPRHRLSGVDILPESIVLARAAGYAQVKLANLDQDKLRFKSKTFDVIICRQVLEHLLFPLKAALEMYRVLQPQGILFVSVPTRENRKFDDDYTHIRPFTRHSLATLLYDAGFKRLDFVHQLRGIPGLGLIEQLFEINLESAKSTLAKQLPLSREPANIEVIARK